MPSKLTGEPAAGFVVVTLNAADGRPWTVTVCETGRVWLVLSVTVRATV